MPQQKVQGGEPPRDSRYGQPAGDVSRSVSRCVFPGRPPRPTRSTARHVINYLLCDRGRSRTRRGIRGVWPRSSSTAIPPKLFFFLSVCVNAADDRCLKIGNRQEGASPCSLPPPPPLSLHCGVDSREVCAWTLCEREWVVENSELTARCKERRCMLATPWFMIVWKDCLLKKPPPPLSFFLSLSSLPHIVMRSYASEPNPPNTQQMVQHKQTVPLNHI